MSEPVAVLPLTIEYAGRAAALGPPIEHPGMYPSRAVASAKRRAHWPWVLWAAATLSLAFFGLCAMGVRYWQWFAVP